MDAEHGLLVQILRDLAAREAAWNADADLRPELSTIYRFLEANRFRRCTEEEIESVVRANPDSGQLHAWGGFVFLRPCETKAWAVPVLTVDYRFTAPMRVGLRLGLFLLDDTGESVVSVGYRFESPDEPGEHAYFHLQHIIELGNGSHPLPTPPWIPQAKLAVPLDVRSHVGLLLCMLAAIYGPTSEVVLQIATSQYQEMLNPHLQQIRWATDIRSH